MMISVIGANGMVGTEIVSEANSRGHEVSSYTRSGSTPGAVALDLSDTAAVVNIIDSSDVTVISVAGRDDYDAVVAAHEALVAAKPQGRFLVLGGAGALQVGEGLLLDTPEFPDEYKPEARTFAKVYAAYNDSTGLEWTMAAPSPMIAPGTRTGDYKLGTNSPVGGFVSTQDLAVALVDEIEDPKHGGGRFTVASSDEAAAQASN